MKCLSVVHVKRIKSKSHGQGPDDSVNGNGNIRRSLLGVHKCRHIRAVSVFDQLALQNLILQCQVFLKGVHLQRSIQRGLNLACAPIDRGFEVNDIGTSMFL